MESPQRSRFDWEALGLAWGMGAAALLFAGICLWAGLGEAPGGRAYSTGFTTAQRLARLLPTSVQQKIVVVLGAVFALCGLVFFGLGFHAIFRHFRGR